MTLTQPVFLDEGPWSLTPSHSSVRTSSSPLPASLWCVLLCLTYLPDVRNPLPPHLLSSHLQTCPSLSTPSRPFDLSYLLSRLHRRILHTLRPPPRKLLPQSRFDQPRALGDSSFPLLRTTLRYVCHPRIFHTQSQVLYFNDSSLDEV